MRSIRHPPTIAWLLMIPLLPWLPEMGKWAFPPGSSFTDGLIAHFTNAWLIADAWRRFGEIPLWSDTYLGGFPLIADPLNGLWYPFGWLSLIWPSAWGFNLTLMGHLLMLGAGMFRWLRLEGYDQRAALLGSWVLMLFPKVIAHWGAGHFTMLYAFAWTPWVLVAERMRRGCSEGSIRTLLLPGMVLGLAWLADLRWGAILTGIWLGYAIFGEWQGGRKESLVYQAGRLLLQPIVGLMLSAPLLLPFLEWLPRTTRSGLRPEEAMVYSLPPYSLLGIVFPGFGRFHEWVTYLGVVPVCMVVLVIAVPSLRRSLRGWLILGILALIGSLGSNLPGFEEAMQLPGLALLRVPARLWFGVGLVAALCTAAGVDWLMTSPRIMHPDVVFWLSAIWGFVVFLAIGWRLLFREFPWLLTFGALLLGLVILAIALWERQRLKKEMGWVILALISLVDLVVAGRTWITFRSDSEVWRGTSGLVSFLVEQPGIFRVYSPSFSLPQYVAARYGLELADGVHPLQTKAYVEFMQEATGVAPTGYSVTLPPFVHGDPEKDNRFFVPRPDLLGWWNVKYVVSAFPLEAEGLELIDKIDDSLVYVNRLAFPRVWVQSHLNWPPRVDGEARIIDRTPNQWHLRARGPGWLILAEVSYPGWEATLDGQPWKVGSLGGLFRAVAIPEGEHVVVIRFRPRAYEMGIGLAILGWGISLLSIGVNHRPKKQRAEK
ncbi:hypothetical protein [uncultured Thermanaerothrix sp.]|uniref:hypothetical protein n=1 Tax=uncultured Thermanaerothrix sp. TaxID=1195149 RepID=UPI00260CD3C1|nr:hypothetical protein [uncultured Thermanaerothrix sp.]